LNNLDKLKKAFAEALDLDVAKITDDLSYGSETWDSVAHMALIASIESEFDIMIDTNDVIDMSSFQKAKEILRKYEIEL
jgi:acyl carrier protein